MQNAAAPLAYPAALRGNLTRERLVGFGTKGKADTHAGEKSPVD